jgi:two-component sensor histidine kinase
MNRFSRLFPTASIGSYLVALAAVIALPLLAFVAILLFQLEISERDTLRRETAEDAQSLGRNVDRKLQDTATTGRLLAASPELESGDLAAFHNRTQSILRSESLYVILVAKNGQQLLNTRVPFGTKLNRIGNLPSLLGPLASGRIEVSDVFIGVTSNRWVFNVTLPLPAQKSSEAAALILAQNAEDMEGLITDDGLPSGWSVALLDGSGHVVSSNGPEGMAAGTEFPKERLALLTGFRGVVEDGHGAVRTMIGYAQLPGWSWKVVIWGPIASAQASIISIWRQLIWGSVILLSLGVLLTYAVARQLRVPIRQIADMAERMGQGEIVSPVETKITEANQVAVALSNASFDRSETEDRIHLILHELVHRTKNILALVQAMMRQLARQGTSMEEFQKAVGNRLEGLAKSIEALAGEQWTGVSIRRVMEIHLDTFIALDGRIEIRGDDFMLRVEAVQNLGLILHELATNSVKYGALSVPGGRVLVDWSDLDDDIAGRAGLIRLRWLESDGPVVTKPARTGFGTTIIERHAASAFSATVHVEFREDGLRWTMTAPRSALERCPTDDPVAVPGA